MAVVGEMLHVAIVIKILLLMQQEKKLTLVRAKERFLTHPSVGGGLNEPLAQRLHHTHPLTLPHSIQHANHNNPSHNGAQDGGTS